MGTYDVPPEALASLSPPSRQCIERLRAHEPETTIDLTGRPTTRLAAVLVVLYEKHGKLRVLLTTRSKLLRSHPGQTALPGGKVDETDVDVTETAYREANEEVALPVNSPSIHTICIMRPFLSATKLVVTPVVALLTDLSILHGLKASESEVSCIFEHPLEAILDPTLMESEPVVEKGSEDWPYETDFRWSTDIEVPWDKTSMYRMHRFRSSASPIKGLTSDILIAVAETAHDRPPTYERYAPAQRRGIQSVLDVLRSEALGPYASSGAATPIGVDMGPMSSAPAKVVQP